MANKNIIINLVILASSIVNLLHRTNHVREDAREQNNENNAIVQGASCRNQVYYELRVICRQMEAQILAATVRIEMNGYHIGNIWAHNLEKDHKTGAVTRLYTMIALNDLDVAELNC